MFKMIGGDGREYGPATAEELSVWILDHRANGQTMVQVEGGSEWQPLSTVPEFEEVLRQAYSGTAAGLTRSEPSMQQTPGAIEAWDAAPAAAFSTGDCLGRAWVFLRGHFLLVSAGCALVWAILTVSAMATCIGGVLGLVLSGALYGGLMLLYLGLMRGQPASLGTLFTCFGPRFVPLMLIAIVTQLLSQIGLIFCLIPGLILKVIWAFALPLAADRGLPFWPALEVSRRTVQRHFFRVALLMCVAFLPLLVFEVYGGLWMMTFLTDILGPPGTWTLDAIQDKKSQIGEFMMTLGLQEQLVVLLSMPFGYAALLQAYEDLFGPRRAGADR